MMRRFVKTVSTVLAGCAALISLGAEANAQDIQLTGPLAGAPAVRQLRLHRAGRFEVAIGSSFTLLDQYLRTAMPGGTLTYHFTDWIGIGVFGGYGLQYNTGLADELQNKAVSGYNCNARPWTQACQLTGVNLTRGSLVNDQFGHITWMVAPQVVAIPFRGKISLFSSFFIDADIAFFAGAAFVGVKERACGGTDDSGNPHQACSTYDASNDPTKSAFTLASRVAIAPTFGLGLNFYGSSFFGVGFEWRAFPFSWNTGGFDNHGGGPNSQFPDNNINSADREFHFNTMATIQLKFAFPVAIKTSL